MSARLAVLYEHPEWFARLFAELGRRGIAFTELDPSRLRWDPEAAPQFGLLVNRMSPSAWNRGRANAIFTTLDYLVHLEERGIAMVNGPAAYRVEISKARQLDLFRRCGVGYPKARVINHASQALAAAEGLEYPLAVKPNVGGSGAGIRRFESREELEAALPSLGLGVDSTALVQEFLPAREGCITRVEALDGEFLYAIRIWTDFQSFNLCPADVCQVAPPQADGEACVAAMTKKFRTERCEPPPEAVAGALKLARAAQLDIGGIEYLVDDRTGQVCYYDVNALSNFVAGAPELLGFDPTARFADYLERRLQATG